MPQKSRFECHKSGFNSGWALGFAIGMKHGRTEGIALVLEGIALVLEVKFGTRGLRLMPHIERLGPADLCELMRRLTTAVSLRELRKHLTNSDNQS